MKRIYPGENCIAPAIVFTLSKKSFWRVLDTLLRGQSRIVIRAVASLETRITLELADWRCPQGH